MTDLQKTIDDLNLMNVLCHGTVLDDAIALLKDRQEIVRCKDCKYWHKTIYDTPKWLPCMSVQTSGKWYCADGEREGR